MTWDENLTQAIWNNLSVGDVNPLNLSPLVLAYIGDSIYDLVIRTWLMSKGNMQVNKINHHACKLVKAQTQSKIVDIIEPMLSEEEESIYKRGRNAKSHTSAKNASIVDYRRATGFEALMGYLYLSGQYERMTMLIKEALTQLGEM